MSHLHHKLCFITDIHLDHLSEVVSSPDNGLVRELSEQEVKDFCNEVNNENPDSVLITGDISTAEHILVHLGWLKKYLKTPFRFVLGNHDFYNGSISQVRTLIGATPFSQSHLNTAGIIELTKETALVGHDGWYDGGYSNWFKSKLVMTDYLLIQELRFQPPAVIHKVINDLAKESADHVLNMGLKAHQRGFKTLLVATHVPPFRNNSRAPDGSLSDMHWLPNMSSKRMGDVLLELSRKCPNMHIVCLCGHTHSSHVESYAPNLECHTGKSVYGKPGISIKMIEV